MHYKKETLVPVLTISAILLISIIEISTFFYFLQPSFTNKVALSSPENSEKFIKNEYSEIKDLAKSFLTIVIGVFVASITFSEKIVATNTSSSWAKTNLIICWFMLLGSIVLIGCGSVYLAGCFKQALYTPSPTANLLLKYAGICYLSAGVCFGLGMSTMLAAGIISFLMPKESKKFY